MIPLAEINAPIATHHNAKPFLFLKRLAFLLAILLLATEAGIRLGRLVDVPTYTVNDQIGFMINPSQSGNFLNKNHWVFNNRSMGVAARWNPTERPNLLLIGNSIVMGGNPYDQPNKLGPLLQQRIGSAYAVWPIAVGGWTNVNETVYLQNNPDVASAANFFVWEYMRGGLSDLSRWRGDYIWPRHRPLCATWYVFRRYLWPHLAAVNMSELPPIGATNPVYLHQFAAEVETLSKTTKRATPGIILLYPVKADYIAFKQGIEWLPERAKIEKICADNHLVLVDVSRSPLWNENLYRGGTHPTAEGNAILARILSAAIRANLP